MMFEDGRGQRRNGVVAAHIFALFWSQRLYIEEHATNASFSLLRFCRRTAMPEKAGGKVGAAFRYAVLSLAKAEQEYARLDDGGDDGYEPVAFDAAVDGAAQWNGATRNAAQRGRRRRRSSDAGTDGVAGVWATLPWHTCLRRVFDRRLDLDGDGYLTEGDLTACLPEIGVDVDSRGKADVELASIPATPGLISVSGRKKYCTGQKRVLVR